jgi:hypothetical protein
MNVLEEIAEYCSALLYYCLLFCLHPVFIQNRVVVYSSTFCLMQIFHPFILRMTVSETSYRYQEDVAPLEKKTVDF